MSSYYDRKRSSKRKKKEEATLVGDLFRILFAVSMLVVAILVAFLVFKNVNGFKLPDLKVTTAAETTEQAVTSLAAETEKARETAKAETAAKTTAAESGSETLDPEEQKVQDAIESAEAAVEESLKAAETAASGEADESDYNDRTGQGEKAVSSAAVQEREKGTVGNGPVSSETGTVSADGPDADGVISDNGPSAG